MNKVSIIVPVYKVEKYLDRCLNSLVSQDYQNIEIILVDDGSPDKCPLMCDQWKKRDERIKVVHKPNGGLSSARNAGIEVADGVYISFVDSDDYVEPFMISTMVEALERTKSDLAICGRKRMSRTGAKEMFVLPKEKEMTSKEAVHQLLIHGCVEEASWDKLYKKEFFDNRRFPVGEVNEDIVLITDILCSCEKIVHVGKSMYFYCENEGSITQSGYKPNKYVILKHLDSVRSIVEQHYPDLKNEIDLIEERYCRSILYLLLDNKETRKSYKKEYKEFYQRFASVFWKTKRNTKKIDSDFLKGTLIYFRLYSLIHELKKHK